MVKEAKSGVSSNGTEMLEQILDRESELLVEAEEARQEGKDLVSQAQKGIAQISADTQKQAHVRAETESAAIESETHKKIEALQGQYDQECAALRDELMKNVDKGVDFVIDLVTAPMLLPMTLQVDKGVKYVIDRVAGEEKPAGTSAGGTVKSGGGESSC